MPVLRSERSFVLRTKNKSHGYGCTKRLGIDPDTTAKRGVLLCGIEADDLFSHSRQKIEVRARSLFCYWVPRELGVSHKDLARQLRISVPAITYSVQSGEDLVKQQNTGSSSLNLIIQGRPMQSAGGSGGAK